jgi:cytosine/adenosine deaminase-related metal-dependent hydrolase
MSTLLVRNTRILVTMDDKRREIEHGALFIRDGFIEQVGHGKDLPQAADEVVDLSGHIVLPGFVNTHHHLFQTLDRAFPVSQNGNLVQWLKGLYPRWEKLDGETVVAAIELGLAEIALSGATTVADHHYLWLGGMTAPTLFDAAMKVGVRFHLGHGSQNIGKPQGGFAPVSLIEDEDRIIANTKDVIAKFHDPLPGSFRQVFVAPSSLRTATPSLLETSAALASKHGLRFHFHLGETAGETEFTMTKFGKRPAQVAEELGCLTPHTWVAHGVHFDQDDVGILHRCGCGICHCPSSNMRLGSGIAPIGRYLKSGLTVGLGVDGSASNDSSSMLVEIRAALLLSRVNAETEIDRLDARTVLAMATRNGAELLGRTDTGVLEPGRAADFVAIDSNRIEIVGSQDPVAAIAFCALTRVDYSWVHGKPLVQRGELVGYDLASLIDRIQKVDQSAGHE